MCRSIKTLRQGDVPATDDEIRAAALQYVRKISGFRHPSQRNTEAFEAAVATIATASQSLLDQIAAARGQVGRVPVQSEVSNRRTSTTTGRSPSG